MGVFSVRKTTEQFISEARLIHGNKYDYSKVEYKTNKNKVCIICPVHGEFLQNAKSHLQGHGCRKCYGCSKSKYGIATCDIPNCCTTPYYSHWRGVLERCVSSSFKSQNKTYKNCTVCQEWLVLSNFKSWFENPKNGFREGYHLDKDIIVKGNKLYSPETCCFVPPEINLIFARKNKKSTLPIGVVFKDNRYIASYHSHIGKKHLGCFNTAEEAFNAYKNAKEKCIKELAEKYFQEGKITERVYNALMKYEVEITD